MNPDDTVNKEGQKYWHLKMPLFEGEDLMGWTFRMERFFNVNEVPENEKLNAAVIGLEGKAFNWFQWVETRRPVTRWGELKQGVIKRFHATGVGDNYECLAGLKRSGTMLEFREMFEMISATLNNVTEETLMGMYMNGLKEEIKAEVRVLKPKSLNDLMNIASTVEGQNVALEKARQRRESKVGQKEQAMRWMSTIPPPPKFASASGTPRNAGIASGTSSYSTKGDETTKTTNTKAAHPSSITSSGGSSSRGTR